MITHPSLSLLSHNNGLFSRADLFTVVFCVTDDWMKQHYQSANAPRKRRGPKKAEMADSEVLTVLLVGEMCQIHRESAWLRQVRTSYRHLFPALPSDGRFSRRAQAVRGLLRDLRQASCSGQTPASRRCACWTASRCRCAPACAWHTCRIRQSTQPWMQPISGAEFGYNSSKRQFYFGLHPGLLMKVGLM